MRYILFFLTLIILSCNNEKKYFTSVKSCADSIETSSPILIQSDGIEFKIPSHFKFSDEHDFYFITSSKENEDKGTFGFRIDDTTHVKTLVEYNDLEFHFFEEVEGISSLNIINEREERINDLNLFWTVQEYKENDEWFIYLGCYLKSNSGILSLHFQMLEKDFKEDFCDYTSIINSLKINKT